LRRAPDEDAVRNALELLATKSAGAVAVEDADGSSATLASSPARGIDLLDVSTFGRVLDERWVRTSYSRLTAAAHEAGPPVVAQGSGAAEADEAATHDEPSVALGGHADHLDVAVPMGDIPGGARVGTLVHDILEHTDFAAADLAGALSRAAEKAGAARVLVSGQDVLVAGLVASLDTPLGPLLDGRRLRGLTRADRLDELAFDLPLAGGDSPTGAVTMAAIADLFATLPAGDPVARYHERLRDPVLAAEVRGFLTGSIDLVARVGDRHVVIDYKTNRLGLPGEPLTGWHYRPEALTRSMFDANYPLQACLYSVALHRYLRWRLPAYDPERHLGGCAYLFLRGMVGPATPAIDGQPFGVFAWHPPASFVTGLSDLLDRGST